jgi:endonuclease YncB( thermonuclease family)
MPGWFTLGLIALPLAAFSAVFFWDGGARSWALPTADLPASGRGDDAISARFARCVGPLRHTCVVDGDTFWLQGRKIRIADINTPETSEPACASEARRGEAATARLVELLNDGPFTLRPVNRDFDSYGRQLRIVRRHGESLGATLIAEGLAEPWRGRRGDWCGGA